MTAKNPCRRLAGVFDRMIPTRLRSGGDEPEAHQYPICATTVQLPDGTKVTLDPLPDAPHPLHDFTEHFGSAADA